MESTIQDVLEVLRKDLDAARKSRLFTAIGGVLISLIVFVVFWNVAHQIKQNFRPENIAVVAAHATRMAVKDARPAVEEAFRANMPKFLASLRRSLIEDLVPSLRKQIEAELSRIIAKSFENSAGAFNAAVKAAIAQVKAAAPTGKPTPEFLSGVIVREFARETERRFNETPEQTLGQEFKDSLELLRTLDKKTDMLLSGKPRTREEALEVKFLRAWVSLLERGEVPPEPARPVTP